MALAAFAAAPALAQPLAKPKDRPLLEVTGKIKVTNDGEKATFDLALLESIGVVKTKTSTAWTEGTPQFEGIMLKTLLERLGASGDAVIAVALNDYKVEIPIADFQRYPVILAYRMNGELLKSREGAALDHLPAGRLPRAQEQGDAVEVGLAGQGAAGEVAPLVPLVRLTC